ncbi:MAG: hypothetical protein HQL57_05960 [Magnetococcales bacterium]|nr:hypothetical protein [Magnetococcales bacterium]
MEYHVATLVARAVEASGLGDVALAGGVFANIKVNGAIRRLPGVRRCGVFPHRGDGGLAVGAGAALGLSLSPDAFHSPRPLTTLSLGGAFSDAAVAAVLRRATCRHERLADPAREGAALLAAGRVIGWFQGGMEYGPRALGARSILALATLKGVRARLNRELKRRAWYQPFCPSLLESEAERFLADYGKRPDRFMTMLYQLRESERERLGEIAGVDGSCRPQIVADGSGVFAELLGEVKRLTGDGILLNTSFNFHGEPMVRTPEEALDAFRRMPLDHLVMGPFRVDR